MDPKALEFYINPSGTMFLRGEFLGYAWGPDISVSEMEELILKASKGNWEGVFDIREAVRLAKLWNTLRDSVSILRTLTVHHVEAFIEPGYLRGGASIFVQLHIPRGSVLEKHPERKRWGGSREGHYIVRQEAINLAKAIEDAGFVSFVEERALRKWDVGAYVDGARDAKA